MSLSARIASHLPFLRRYARALTGSQTSGDAYVAAVLEALIADVSIFPESTSDRTSLYRLFSQLFSKIDIPVKVDKSPYAWEAGAAANLAMIPPLPRQAFLLVSVEGFNPAEAPCIAS
jgi:DNA-directed RNA polymerase specialized sigma24 family protein